MNNTVNKYKEIGLDNNIFSGRNGFKVLPPLMINSNNNRAHSINRNFDLDLIKGDTDKYTRLMNENQKKTVPQLDGDQNLNKMPRLAL